MTVPIQWIPREPPLSPGVVIAEGEAARALARAVLLRTDEELGALEGVAGPALIAIVGAREALPWADGAQYFGRSDPQSALWLPVHLAPSVPAPLLERALVGKGAQVPIAVLVHEDTPRTVSLADARKIDRRTLEAWLAS